MAWGIVRADSIKKGIRASRHLDPQDLKMAWDVVIEALARAEPSKRRKFEKSVYVQHIGLMGVLTQSKTTVVNSTLPEDVPAEDLIFQRRDGKMTLAYVTHLVDNRSYYPLSLIALWGEHVAMARAWRMIRACEASLRRPLVCAWHIDGITLLEVPAALKKRMREVKYPDRTFVYQIKEDEKTAYGVLPRHSERWSATSVPCRLRSRAGAWTSTTSAPSWRAASRTP